MNATRVSFIDCIVTQLFHHMPYLFLVVESNCVCEVPRSYRYGLLFIAILLANIPLMYSGSAYPKLRLISWDNPEYVTNFIQLLIFK